MGGKSKIALFDVEKFTESEQIVDINKMEDKQNKKIGHCTIDPIHEYFTYTINNQLYVLDKNNKK